MTGYIINDRERVGKFVGVKMPGSGIRYVNAAAYPGEIPADGEFFFNCFSG